MKDLRAEYRKEHPGLRGLLRTAVWWGPEYWCSTLGDLAENEGQLQIGNRIKFPHLVYGGSRDGKVTLTDTLGDTRVISLAGNPMEGNRPSADITAKLSNLPIDAFLYRPVLKVWSMPTVPGQYLPADLPEIEHTRGLVLWDFSIEPSKGYPGGGGRKFMEELRAQVGLGPLPARLRPLPARYGP
jgi:hypothetical protein